MSHRHDAIPLFFQEPFSEQSGLSRAVCGEGVSPAALAIASFTYYCLPVLEELELPPDFCSVYHRMIVRFFVGSLAVGAGVLLAGTAGFWTMLVLSLLPMLLWHKLPANTKQTMRLSGNSVAYLIAPLLWVHYAAHNDLARLITPSTVLPVTAITFPFMLLLAEILKRRYSFVTYSLHQVVTVAFVFELSTVQIGAAGFVYLMSVFVKRHYYGVFSLLVVDNRTMLGYIWVRLINKSFRLIGLYPPHVDDFPGHVITMQNDGEVVVMDRNRNTLVGFCNFCWTFGHSVKSGCCEQHISNINALFKVALFEKYHLHTTLMQVDNYLSWADVNNYLSNSNYYRLGNQLADTRNLPGKIRLKMHAPTSVAFVHKLPRGLNNNGAVGTINIMHHRVLLKTKENIHEVFTTYPSADVTYYGISEFSGTHLFKTEYFVNDELVDLIANREISYSEELAQSSGRSKCFNRYKDKDTSPPAFPCDFVVPMVEKEVETFSSMFEAPLTTDDEPIVSQVFQNQEMVNTRFPLVQKQHKTTSLMSFPASKNGSVSTTARSSASVPPSSEGFITLESEAAWNDHTNRLIGLYEIRKCVSTPKKITASERKLLSKFAGVKRIKSTALSENFYQENIENQSLVKKTEQMQVNTDQQRKKFVQYCFNQLNALENHCNVSEIKRGEMWIVYEKIYKLFTAFITPDVDETAVKTYEELSTALKSLDKAKEPAVSNVVVRLQNGRVDDNYIEREENEADEFDEELVEDETIDLSELAFAVTELNPIVRPTRVDASLIPRATGINGDIKLQTIGAVFNTTFGPCLMDVVVENEVTNDVTRVRYEVQGLKLAHLPPLITYSDSVYTLHSSELFYFKRNNSSGGPILVPRALSDDFLVSLEENEDCDYVFDRVYDESCLDFSPRDLFDGTTGVYIQQNAIVTISFVVILIMVMNGSAHGMMWNAHTVRFHAWQVTGNMGNFSHNCDPNLTRVEEHRDFPLEFMKYDKFLHEFYNALDDCGNVVYKKKAEHLGMTKDDFEITIDAKLGDGFPLKSLMYKVDDVYIIFHHSHPVGQYIVCSTGAERMTLASYNRSLAIQDARLVFDTARSALEALTSKISGIETPVKRHNELVEEIDQIQKVGKPVDETGLVALVKKAQGYCKWRRQELIHTMDHWWRTITVVGNIGDYTFVFFASIIKNSDTEQVREIVNASPNNVYTIDPQTYVATNTRRFLEYTGRFIKYLETKYSASKITYKLFKKWILKSTKKTVNSTINIGDFNGTVESVAKQITEKDIDAIRELGPESAKGVVSARMGTPLVTDEDILNAKKYDTSNLGNALMDKRLSYVELKILSLEKKFQDKLGNDADFALYNKLLDTFNQPQMELVSVQPDGEKLIDKMNEIKELIATYIVERFGLDGLNPVLPATQLAIAAEKSNVISPAAIEEAQPEATVPVVIEDEEIIDTQAEPEATLVVVNLQSGQNETHNTTTVGVEEQIIGENITAGLEHEGTPEIVESEPEVMNEVKVEPETKMLDMIPDPSFFDVYTPLKNFASNQYDKIVGGIESAKTTFNAMFKHVTNMTNVIEPTKPVIIEALKENMKKNKTGEYVRVNGVYFILGSLWESIDENIKPVYEVLLRLKNSITSGEIFEGYSITGTLWSICSAMYSGFRCNFDLGQIFGSKLFAIREWFSSGEFSCKNYNFHQKLAEACEKKAKVDIVSYVNKHVGRERVLHTVIPDETNFLMIRMSFGFVVDNFVHQSLISLHPHNGGYYARTDDEKEFVKYCIGSKFDQYPVNCGTAYGNVLVDHYLALINMFMKEWKNTIFWSIMIYWFSRRSMRGMNDFTLFGLTLALLLVDYTIGNINFGGKKSLGGFIASYVAPAIIPVLHDFVMVLQWALAIHKLEYIAYAPAYRVTLIRFIAFFGLLFIAVYRINLFLIAISAVAYVERRCLKSPRPSYMSSRDARDYLDKFLMSKGLEFDEGLSALRRAYNKNKQWLDTDEGKREFHYITELFKFYSDNSHSGQAWTYNSPADSFLERDIWSKLEGKDEGVDVDYVAFKKSIPINRTYKVRYNGRTLFAFHNGNELIIQRHLFGSGQSMKVPVPAKDIEFIGKKLELVDGFPTPQGTLMHYRTVQTNEKCQVADPTYKGGVCLVAPRSVYPGTYANGYHTVSTKDGDCGLPIFTDAGGLLGYHTGAVKSMPATGSLLECLGIKELNINFIVKPDGLAIVTEDPDYDINIGDGFSNTKLLLSREALDLRMGPWFPLLETVEKAYYGVFDVKDELPMASPEIVNMLEFTPRAKVRDIFSRRCIIKSEKKKVKFSELIRQVTRVSKPEFPTFKVSVENTTIPKKFLIPTWWGRWVFMWLVALPGLGKFSMPFVYVITVVACITVVSFVVTYAILIIWIIRQLEWFVRFGKVSFRAIKFTAKVIWKLACLLYRLVVSCCKTIKMRQKAKLEGKIDYATLPDGIDSANNYCLAADDNVTPAWAFHHVQLLNSKGRANALLVKLNDIRLHDEKVDCSELIRDWLESRGFEDILSKGRSAAEIKSMLGDNFEEKLNSVKLEHNADFSQFTPESDKKTIRNYVLSLDEEILKMMYENNCEDEGDSKAVNDMIKRAVRSWKNVCDNKRLAEAAAEKKRVEKARNAEEKANEQRLAKEKKFANVQDAMIKLIIAVQPESRLEAFDSPSGNKTAKLENYALKLDESNSKVINVISDGRVIASVCPLDMEIDLPSGKFSVQRKIGGEAFKLVVEELKSCSKVTAYLKQHLQDFRVSRSAPAQ